MNKLALWYHLRQLANGKVKDPDKGICENLRSQEFYRPTKIIAEYSKGWPFLTGSVYYPIPASKSDKTCGAADSAYDAAAKAGTLWDFSTEYGQLRRDLCLHMMAALENESLLCYYAFAWFGHGNPP